MKIKALLSLTGGMILGFATAHAADKKAAINQTTTADQDFVMQAYQIDLGEVKMGQLAQKRGESQTVKDYGKMIESDHKLNEDQIKRIAKAENVKLPTKPTADDQATYDRVSKLKGAAFDKAFSDAMVSGHEKAVQLFTQEVDRAQDPMLKDYVQMTLPTLRAHHDVAQVAQRMTANESNAKAR
jgi:putative membrane protein